MGMDLRCHARYCEGRISSTDRSVGRIFEFNLLEHLYDQNDPYTQVALSKRRGPYTPSSAAGPSNFANVLAKIRVSLGADDS